jgi:hypothetical protein
MLTSSDEIALMLSKSDVVTASDCICRLRGSQQARVTNTTRRRLIATATDNATIPCRRSFNDDVGGEDVGGESLPDPDCIADADGGTTLTAQ